MYLTYNVSDKPKFGNLIVFAIQQLLAIMAATIAIPMIVSQATGVQMSISAALVGAGFGTIVYLLFTKFKSPVFLGSSFALLGSMSMAFTGAVTASLGYLGLIIGAILAGLVYVIIAVVTKFVGSGWIDKIMPAVVIGSTVAIIGLSLAKNAVGDMLTADAGGNQYIALICGLITLFVIIAVSVFSKGSAKLIPFIIGIIAGYAVAFVFTLIGKATGAEALFETQQLIKYIKEDFIPQYASLNNENGEPYFNFKFKEKYENLYEFLLKKYKNLKAEIGKINKGRFLETKFIVAK